MLEVKTFVEKKINDLWQEYSDQAFCEVSPCCVSEINTKGIVFIGLNPSLKNEDRTHLLKESKEADFYSLYLEGDPQHRYFRKFIDISKQVDLSWGHMDLLYVRETKQKKVEKILKLPNGVDFIYKQLMVSKEVLDTLLNQSNPIIFVVNNSLARTFLGKDKKIDNSGKEVNVWMGYDFEWSEEFGTYFLGRHPFFFTSMLTGQRALDLGSYERLVWHVNLLKNTFCKPEISK